MNGRLRTAPMALLLMVGCSIESADPRDIIDPDGGKETLDLPAPNEASEGVLDEPADVEDKAAPLDNDDGVIAEVPKTCETVLEPWQCIGQANCPDWAACFGVGICEDPPCWGLCEPYPGTCLAGMYDALCESDDDCSGTDLCAGRILYESGKVKTPGFCRSRPSEVACYEDGHCPGDGRCAGELVGEVGAYRLGAEYFGRCVDSPPEDGCWEDGECPAGEKCAGTVLCGFPAGGCQEDTPGKCETDSWPGCFEDEDCQGNPEGGFCTGAYSCQDGGCFIDDAPGFCTGPPGFGGCWEDGDCGVGFVCRAVLACPPGTLCHGTAAHVGQCGEAPKAGEGVEVSLAEPKVQVGVPFWITLLNQSATAIYLDPCLAMSLQRWNTDSKKWEYWPVLVMHDACDEGQPGPLLMIPPGNGMVFGGKMGEFDAGTFRLNTLYQIGCVQGVANPACKTDFLEANSLEFESEK